MTRGPSVNVMDLPEAPTRARHVLFMAPSFDFGFLERLHLREHVFCIHPQFSLKWTSHKI
jgi:hypothetical protein